MEEHIDGETIKNHEKKKYIQHLIERGSLREAESLLSSYQKEVPHDQDIYLLRGVLYMMEGHNQRAIDIMKEGLIKDPQNYNLLFNLGYLFENQEDILNAFNFYRQAEYALRTSAQALDLKERIKGIKRKMKSQISIGAQDYLIKVIAGKKMYKIEYPLEELMIRKKILHRILKYLDPLVETALEIQCGPGIITRTLSSIGVHAVGIDSHNYELLKAVIFEMVEKVRLKDKIGITEFYNISSSLEYLKSIPPYDSIILSPMSFDYYGQENLDDTLQKIHTMASKAKKQMFLYVPPPQDDLEIHRELMNSLYHLDIGRESTISTISDDHLPGSLLLMTRERKRITTSKIIPSGLSSVNSSSSILEVCLQKCMDIQYFSYSTHGWHPFIEAMKEQLENPEITYNSSILKTFYKTFVPKNRQEQWFEEESKDIKPLCQGWPDTPWHRGPKRIPKKYVTERMVETGGNQHFGPNSQSFGEKQYQKLIHTYELLSMHGYHPEIFPDGYITGYLLIKDDDYRFIVLEGQHRIAALSLMGVEKITCKFTKERPHIVDFRDSEKWSQVKNGLYRRSVAERVFTKFFQENGREKARHLGII